ncbi:hypothetical protein [Kamptonema sp. UHCC 0994]|uniref:hypothetical protein n=1 Tax=Kamptonema sp. UHCC 0994 TaxID=3031329 RepID=UPI0023B912A9|nr:hypothetical protein [Kamptonema sp. UHCC 0994]MDF0555086.1 hypothetical protein [Kamptonema sp. UHCC 0994]
MPDPTASTANVNVIVQKFKVPVIEIAFLLGLSLNFLRIGHALIVLETSRSCRDYQDCMEKNCFKWHIPFSQISCLLLFVVIGIYLVLFGLPNFEQKSAEVLLATIALFFVIFFWDAPTFSVYIKYINSQKNISSVLIEIVFNHSIGKQNENYNNNCIARALINWVIYDLACFALLILGFALIGILYTNKLCLPLLGCLEENYIKLAWASFLLILVSILDYSHPKLFKIKLPFGWLTNGIFYIKLPFGWLTNGIFYWGDESEKRESDVLNDSASGSYSKE